MRNTAQNTIQTDQIQKKLEIFRHLNQSLKLEVEQLQKELALYRQLNEGLCWAICELKNKYQDVAPHKHLALPNFSQKEDTAYTKSTT